MPSFFTSAVDDRGNAVEFRDPMYHGSELTKGERVTMNQRQSGKRVPSWAIYLAPLVAVALVAPSYTRLPLETLAVRAVLILLVVVVGWFVVIPMYRHMLWARDWKDRYKRLGKCPACQYAIRSLEPEVDGCTKCPECGSAWKLQST